MVADFLHEHDFPARRTANPKIICMQSGERVKYGALYDYLPGRTIPWEAYTQAHLKLLGKTMSDMHATLRQLNAPTLPHVADEYGQIAARMQRYFADENVHYALAAKLQLAMDPEVVRRMIELLRISKRLPCQQPLHMDFVRGNILFADTPGDPVLTGVLDFEKTAFGHPSFDIARTLAFLLVDCKYKPADKVRKYFLLSGYNKRGQARFANLAFEDRGQKVDLLEDLTTLFLLHDFYKFLRHNPYESLPQNEHFLRTKAELLRRNVISRSAVRSDPESFRSLQAKS